MVCISTYWRDGGIFLAVLQQAPQCTSILSGSDYMAEVRDDNPTNCYDMFCMTLDLFYHLVNELKHYGYLKEGKGRADV